MIKYHNEEQCKDKRHWVRKINNKIISIDKNGITWLKPNHLISVNSITSEVESLKFKHDMSINDLINLNIEQSTSKNQNLNSIRNGLLERVVVTSFLSNVSVRIENRKGENSKNHFCRKLILVYILIYH
ncbi:hypothetical protein BpHYR1_040668 [Brachionus plicatilis]|uniref:Uncharacterized protein n=1 Tax=Brachionus plicatilis TaxID=10195 RepID=A0A3M7RMV1_BRAPC|nr:hypothetical protein BpHYR1_040668 [Brachionus plicatilis]